MEGIEKILAELREYDGPELVLMEVCGSHTAAIAKSGIRDLISPKIKLIGGPGCPVCVTPTSYIDELIKLSLEKSKVVVTFGDLIRVPGSNGSLAGAKGDGASVQMVYSPMDTIKLALEQPDKEFIFAAVGFETTAPVYTILLDEIIRLGISNIKLCTALKTMPRAIEWLLDNNSKIDGFLAPGHVCAITGSKYFEGIAEKYNRPFAVAGFSDEELILAVNGLVKMLSNKQAAVKNYYTSVVSEDGNLKAMSQLEKYFKPYEAVWRGMGAIPDSGLVLREEYSGFDAGSSQTFEDAKNTKGCCCGQILMGRMEPKQCPLFGTACTPKNPVGACMVSFEGGCYQHYING